MNKKLFLKLQKAYEEQWQTAAAISQATTWQEMKSLEKSHQKAILQYEKIARKIDNSKKKAAV